MLFFFFKQKTAYEMRISDWSSDVCSSDLDHVGPVVRRQIAIERLLAVDRLADAVGDQGIGGPQQAVAEQRDDDDSQGADRRHFAVCKQQTEEHTSELQSLMRISYAVFCLKKKHIKRNIPIETT